MDKQTYIYVTPFFPTPQVHFGSYSVDFVKAVERTGLYRVEVFVCGNGPDYEFDGIKVHCFKQKMLPTAILPLLFAKKNVRSFYAAVRRAGIAMDDVAVCHGNTAPFAIYPLAIKKLNPKCKTLLQHHDLASIGLRMGMLRHFWPHKVINYLMLRRALDNIDLHVFISKACQRNFERFPDTHDSSYADYRKLGRGMGGFRPVHVKDSYVLYNGVDTSIFHPAPQPQPSTSTFTIGCIGNFIDMKDHIGLVKAVHRLVDKIPGLRLEILGTNGLGHYREDVEKYVADNGLEHVVSILPHLPHNELPSAYRRWDLFVLPCYFEGLGCVYLESWCCGTPFIACQGQGIADLISNADKHLWLARPHDVDDLAEKIFNFYQNRPAQTLTIDVGIGVLVGGFLKKLKEVTQ